MGFRVIDLWSRKLGVRLASGRFRSRFVKTQFQTKRIILLCPMTFMNLSGEAVKECVDYYRIEDGNTLIVHDDLDIPLGRVKVAGGGGAGGHKGVQSIIDHLGGVGFPRIRIGIGHPRHNESVEDYVLSQFYEDERDTAEEMIHLAVQACELCVGEGIDLAMNRINCQNLGDKEERN